MAAYGWDWTDGGVKLFRDGLQLVEVGTRFPSRDGLRLVDAAASGQADRAQATDYGSVQLFSGDRLVANVNL